MGTRIREGPVRKSIGKHIRKWDAPRLERRAFPQSLREIEKPGGIYMSAGTRATSMTSKRILDDVQPRARDDLQRVLGRIEQRHGLPEGSEEMEGAAARGERPGGGGAPVAPVATTTARPARLRGMTTKAAEAAEVRRDYVARKRGSGFAGGPPEEEGAEAAGAQAVREPGATELGACRLAAEGQQREGEADSSAEEGADQGVHLRGKRRRRGAATEADGRHVAVNM